MSDTGKPDIPLHHIGCMIPAVPGWRALAFAHDAEGKRIEVAPDRFAVAEHPVAQWGILVSISQYSFFGAMLGGGEPPPCPLDANGARLDKLQDYFCLSPPGETMQEAIDRIEAPIRRAAEKARQP
jgi:hypothetical protein